MIFVLKLQEHPQYLIYLNKERKKNKNIIRHKKGLR